MNQTNQQPTTNNVVDVNHSWYSFHYLNSQILVLSGIVLLVAGVLKIFGWNVSPFAQYGRLLSIEIQSTEVVWEILLGLYLVVFRNVVSWFFAFITFSLFALISGYLGLIGQADCGCFGVIKASAWYAFGIDVVLVFLLIATRPTEINLRVPERKEVIWVGSVFTILLLLFSFCHLWFGSMKLALAKLRGTPLGITPSVLNFGTGRVNEILERNLEVQNYSNVPIRLIGGTSDCSCITTKDMPLTINSGDKIQLSIHLRIPSTNIGHLSRRIEIYTDSSQMQTIRLGAVCNVVE